MEFFDVIAKRRSVRKYTAKAIPEQVVQRALDAALLAPNSSNMQPWEFYWVRSPEKKKQLVEACLNQGAARTASELVVAVARVDTWRRNRGLMLAKIAEQREPPKVLIDYYKKIIPFFYFQEPTGILGLVRRGLFFVMSLMRPVPQKPATRADLYNVVIKTTALACENFMLAVVAQGYACCPMEGLDDRRVKKILGLGCGARVVMAISVGEVDPTGIWGDQVRFDRKLFVHEV